MQHDVLCTVDIKNIKILFLFLFFLSTFDQKRLVTDSYYVIDTFELLLSISKSLQIEVFKNYKQTFELFSIIFLFIIYNHKLQSIKPFESLKY